ncbi:MAG TPA: hypothetical protein VFY20_03500 [Gemmatimonadales bacterium]|nr:hypothetical protein [Gemmatimonadales bacterium]
MRTSSKSLLVLASLMSLSLAACSGGESLVAPDGTIPGVGTNPGGSTNPDGTTNPDGSGGSTPGGGSTIPTTSGPSADTTYTGGSPGGSTTGGQTETEQGFRGWELQVLPNGELALRFRQTNLSVPSFSYVVGGAVTGSWQCYNKADNSPNGTPFSGTIDATATLSALSANGSINAVLVTTVLADVCGSTQFAARPVAGQPWTWSGIYLDNPAGRLPLPNISLGDAPVGFSVP